MKNVLSKVGLDVKKEKATFGTDHPPYVSVVGIFAVQ